MPTDKFSAVWVSHSSIKDFITCPRAYYLNNVYKDPKTGHKISLMAPALALGQVVHDVVENLSTLPTATRFNTPLMEQFNKKWQSISGEKGGFRSEQQEQEYKQRGADMIRRIIANPGPLKNLAVKIKMDLPHYWLDENEGIILCGKIDWLEYLPDSDSVHIIDFKTSKREEDPESLQLPIYALLVKNCQKRNIARASYWYLNFSDDLTPVDLPDAKKSHNDVLKIAKQVKLARKLQKFDCPQGDKGCRACQPLEQIIKGQATFVGINDFKQDVYIIPPSTSEDDESIIL